MLVPLLPLSQPLHCHFDSPSGLKLLLISARLVNKTPLIRDLILDDPFGIHHWMRREGLVFLHCALQFLVCSTSQGLMSGVVGLPLVYQYTISIARYHVRQSPDFSCLHLVLGDRERVCILLVNQPHCCLTVSLPEPSHTVPDMVLESPRVEVLGSFSIDVEAPEDFLAAMTTMGRFISQMCFYYFNFLSGVPV